jgi:hypothetical protein
MCHYHFDNDVGRGIDRQIDTFFAPQLAGTRNVKARVGFEPALRLFLPKSRGAQVEDVGPKLSAEQLYQIR